MSQRFEISARSEYRADSSRPADKRYVFVYHITIRNTGTEPARLMSRHWIIIDGNQNREDVRGQGVVGEQPRIEPGQSFSYTSGAVLQAPVGTMQGSYRMRDDDGGEFDVPIPAFRLAVPSALN